VQVLQLVFIVVLYMFDNSDSNAQSGWWIIEVQEIKYLQVIEYHGFVRYCRMYDRSSRLHI